MTAPSSVRDPLRDRASEQQAAAWLGILDGRATDAQRREFDAWLRADARHATAWARLSAASRALDRLTAFRPAPGAEPDPDLPLCRSRSTAWRRRSAALAAAAAIVLLVGYFAIVRRAADPVFQQVIATAIGEMRKVPLPDGSTLDLNTDSAVAVAFTDGERRIELQRGEAHFSVAADPARPFVVSTPRVRVRAVGTAFSVRLHAAAVEVLVAEGKVGVQDALRPEKSLLPDKAVSAAPVLAAGHRAMIATSDATLTPALAVVAPMSAAEIAQRLAWQEQRLEFAPTPLQDVVSEFNRYSTRRLVIADPALARLSIGGSFRAGDWETLVRLLESNFGVAAEEGGLEVRLRRK